MERRERTEEKVQELFHTPAAGDEGTDPEFMQILQNYIFGDVCYTGSLDNRMRELVTITVLAAVQALPQLKAHLGACLHVGCTPVELREAVYQCAPFLGFPRTLNAIAVLNEVLTERRITLPPRTSAPEPDVNGAAPHPPACGDALRERCARLPGGFAQAVPRFLTELSGDFATRSGLDGRTRELLTVVLLAALGGAAAQLKDHVRGALALGSTREELVCALVHASAYMGSPRLFSALDAAGELLEEP